MILAGAQYFEDFPLPVVRPLLRSSIDLFIERQRAAQSAVKRRGRGGEQGDGQREGCGRRHDHQRWKGRLQWAGSEEMREKKQAASRMEAAWHTAVGWMGGVLLEEAK
jgi:hypothetical protein